jgi:hypothetical protein
MDGPPTEELTMTRYIIRIESGAIVTTYTIAAPDVVLAEIKAMRAFRAEYPNRAEYAEVTGRQAAID